MPRSPREHGNPPAFVAMYCSSLFVIMWIKRSGLLLLTTLLKGTSKIYGLGSSAQLLEATIRLENNIKPGQILSQKEVDKIGTNGFNGKSQVDKDFYALVKDKGLFKDMLNTVPAAIPAAVGIGAASQMNNNEKFKDGGEYTKRLKL